MNFGIQGKKRSVEIFGNIVGLLAVHRVVSHDCRKGSMVIKIMKVVLCNRLHRPKVSILDTMEYSGTDQAEEVAVLALNVPALSCVVVYRLAEESCEMRNSDRSLAELPQW